MTDYAIDPLVGSEDVNALIADYESWLHRRAYSMTGPNGHEDLVQEGRIALWHAVESFNPEAGALPAWLTMKANGRMVECVTRGTWTGKPQKEQAANARSVATKTKIDHFVARFKLEMGQAPSYRVIAQSLGMSLSTVSKHMNEPKVSLVPATQVSLESLLDSDFGFQHLLAAADLAEQVMLAYHRGEILSALDKLSPAQKRYVVLRFWCGYVGEEMNSAFGYEPGALWTSKKNGARLKLREELVHLV